MTPMELLIELFNRGYTTVPLDKSPYDYVLKEREEDPHETIKLPDNTDIAAKLLRQKNKEKNAIY